MSAPDASGPIRVVIVDDSDLVAESLERVLRDEPDIECVALAHSESEALAVAAAQETDVVVMDYRLGDADGLEVASRYRQVRPGTQVLVLTGDIADGYMLSRAQAVGVAGILAKTSDIHGSLADTIRHAHAGSLSLTSPPEGARPSA
jgi:DNA-binding NarL/FixJ family response regulator